MAAGSKRKHPANAGNLAGLRVTLCSERGSVQDDWIRELQRCRMEVTTMWTPPVRFSPGMDILICDYAPHVADMLPWEPGAAQSAFILLLPQNGQCDERVVVSAGPHGVIAKPSSAAALRMSCAVAWSQFRYERRLHDRISRLDENLRAIRDVERAKLILMTEQKLNEAAAYKTLREMAMQRQTTVASLAEAIVRGSFFGTA